MRGKRTHGSDNLRYTTCFSLVGGDSHALFRWYGRGGRGKVSENGEKEGWVFTNVLGVLIWYRKVVGAEYEVLPLLDGVGAGGSGGWNVLLRSPPLASFNHGTVALIVWFDRTAATAPWLSNTGRS